MRPGRLRALAATEDLLVVEGAMGLFDGAADGRGATADLARTVDAQVRRSFDLHTYHPRDAGAWDEAYARYLPLRNTPTHP